MKVKTPSCYIDSTETSFIIILRNTEVYICINICRYDHKKSLSITTSGLGKTVVSIVIR